MGHKYIFISSTDIKLIRIYFRITSMVESGLILKWYKDYMPKEHKCDKSLSSVRHKQAKLKTTKGAFVDLFIGIMTATITVLLEICTAILKRKLAAKQPVADLSP